jgi:hypothetical protein
VNLLGEVESCGWLWWLWFGYDIGVADVDQVDDDCVGSGGGS